MKRNIRTFGITTKDTFFSSVLSAIANAAWFWLFVSLDLSHKVLPSVPFNKHFRQNACSPKFGELGQNRIPVLFIRQNLLVKKFGGTTLIESTHNKVTVLSFHSKKLLLCLVEIFVFFFKPKITIKIIKYL